MQPSTPNLRKMQEVREYNQRIGEFVEWLSTEKGIDTCRRLEVEEYDTNPGAGYGECPVCGTELDLHADTFVFWYPAYTNIGEWLAEFFGIDYAEMERERDELLLSLRGGG